MKCSHKVKVQNLTRQSKKLIKAKMFLIPPLHNEINFHFGSIEGSIFCTLIKNWVFWKVLKMVKNENFIMLCSVAHIISENQLTVTCLALVYRLNRLSGLSNKFQNFHWSWLHLQKVCNFLLFDWKKTSCTPKCFCNLSSNHKVM